MVLCFIQGKCGIKMGKDNFFQPFTPWHQYACSPYCSLYMVLSADKENLLNNQELL